VSRSVLSAANRRRKRAAAGRLCDLAGEWARADADMYVVIGPGASELRDAIRKRGPRAEPPIDGDVAVSLPPAPPVVVAVEPDFAPGAAAEAVYELAGSPGLVPRRVVCAVAPETEAADPVRIGALTRAVEAGAQRYIVSVSTFAARARAFTYHTLRNAAAYPGSLAADSLTGAADRRSRGGRRGRADA
jgi:hypothetical protein